MCSLQMSVFFLTTDPLGNYNFWYMSMCACQSDGLNAHASMDHHGSMHRYLSCMHTWSLPYTFPNISSHSHTAKKKQSTRSIEIHWISAFGAAEVTCLGVVIRQAMVCTTTMRWCRSTTGLSFFAPRCWCCGQVDVHIGYGTGEYLVMR